ncbi:Stemmadenine O-acetyltransferase [Sesamum alatum]|uniref:Stemmadenine O-acetyltransferase n=1 Tax=Sesamum alatum TaxID=300844 RepID=A0AAE1Y5X1_9LAMI|nr:Stemmadenine O-acetyltransferase [Sesamum alatum]
MEIEIEVISQETIKPSSPTPESLRKYQLSFLDQIAPPIFMPLVYFYQADAKFSNPGKSDYLKKSLSQVLSRFYPLAGRLVDDLYVDCNDVGAPYVEAVANCSLSQVITNPVPKNMDKFLPYKVNDVQNLGMAVQVTYFQCGGTAVGLVISHKIADALSFFLVANTWAAVARNGNYDDVPAPKFEAAKIFPPRDAAGYKPSTGIVKEELVTKIFTFPASKISTLKERYSGEFPQRRPSRVEALSAFIWTRFISATEMKADPNKIYTVLHAVNLRTRLDPPLSEYHFGNISRLAVAMPSMGADGGSEILQKVREAIRAVNGEYLAQLRQGDKHLNFLKEIMVHANKGELVTFNFTSLCRFPLYEADFGWGKPVWVGSAGLVYKNLVTFMDTTTGDGIEAWINLRKEDMEKFEADLELQQFLSKPKTCGIHNLEIVD